MVSEVATELSRCVEEVKLVVNDRQLQDDESFKELVDEKDRRSLEPLSPFQDCLEVLVVTQPLPKLDPSLPPLEQLDTLTLRPA